ncbi:unnamed protein product [Rotaria magnacalcarata]|uniref:Uncharacterized protein n=1 Tax=Rotaria magnacalcarata TaxID=392030 RepID=A0A8S2QSX5_9BILA|nr:unnamed protein product [Rotaria magnacalcarata]
MALLVYFIICMLCIKVSDGIKCIDDIQMQFSLSELNLTEVMKTLNNLKSSDKKKCQVYIELDSVTTDLVIQFDQSMQLPRLRSFENVHVQISTSIISASPEKNTNQTSINTTVYITCQSNDECDTQFIEEYLTWLIKNNYRNLEYSIRPLILVQGEKKNECTIGNGNNVKPCYNNSCSWYYSVDTTLGEDDIDSQLLNSRLLKLFLTPFLSDSTSKSKSASIAKCRAWITLISMYPKNINDVILPFLSFAFGNHITSKAASTTTAW